MEYTTTGDSFATDGYGIFNVRTQFWVHAVHTKGARVGVGGGGGGEGGGGSGTNKSAEELTGTDRKKPVFYPARPSGNRAQGLRI